MGIWQEAADRHTAGLTAEQRSNPRVRNLVRYAADWELADQAGNRAQAESLLARYDRAVAQLGYDPLA